MDYAVVQSDLVEISQDDAFNHVRLTYLKQRTIEEKVVQTGDNTGFERPPVPCLKIYLVLGLPFGLWTHVMTSLECKVFFNCHLARVRHANINIIAELLHSASCPATPC